MSDVYSTGVALTRWVPGFLAFIAGLVLLGWGAVYPALAGDGHNGHHHHDHHHVDLLLVFPDQPAEHRYLAFHFLVLHPDDGDIDAILDEVRAETIARYPGAVVVEPAEGGVGAQFQFTDPPYWWPAATVDWAYNPSGAPAAVSAVAQTIFQDAANAWNGAGGSPWTFTGGAAISNAPACPAVPDGVNTVAWEPLPPGVIGETCVRFNTATYPATGVEFGIRLSPSRNWTVGEPVSVDLFTVALHEFGHALGLGHTDQVLNPTLPQGPCPGTVMCASYPLGTHYFGPQPDDIAGVVAIYGLAQATATPTATPTPITTPTPTPPGFTVSTVITVPGIARD